jgi:hypothetical protein
MVLGLPAQPGKMGPSLRLLIISLRDEWFWFWNLVLPAQRSQTCFRPSWRLCVLARYTGFDLLWTFAAVGYKLWSNQVSAQKLLFLATSMATTTAMIIQDGVFKWN